MFRVLLLLVCAIFYFQADAQCTGAISVFPYSQDFESGNGNWMPGGTASQWSWGTPVKPVISGSASGTRCWITGTLTESSYTNNQNSTLTSPCFDLSSITSPFVRFKIFWETEKKYDGAAFQYSTDGGINWTTLGAVNDPNSCPSDNWYNTTFITALGSDGWSGNVQPTASCSGGAGNGSSGWKTAQHEIATLAGQTNVRFRFRFAAGSLCNNYDGFAFDDFWIGEKAPGNSDFTFDCNSSNEIDFSSSTTLCNATYSWNFGDPSSGASNTSSLANPVHSFTGPGVYNVTLHIQDNTVSYPSITRQVTIIEANTVVLNPVLCAGDRDGSLQTNIVPAGNYQYQWNTNPVQTTPMISGLSAGQYSVTVSGNNVCPATDHVTIAEPSPLKVFLGNDTVICSGSPLTLHAGIFSAYQWQDGSGIPDFTVTRTGKYFVTVMNNEGCTATDSIQVTMDCSDLYFPSAFSPDNNGRNDLFGAAGNIAAVRNFRLKIFNRWGQLVFQTADPFQKWDGKVDGKPGTTQSFVWHAEYEIAALKVRKSRHGMITAIY